MQRMMQLDNACAMHDLPRARPEMYGPRYARRARTHIRRKNTCNMRVVRDAHMRVVRDAPEKQHDDRSILCCNSGTRTGGLTAMRQELSAGTHYRLEYAAPRCKSHDACGALSLCRDVVKCDTRASSKPPIMASRAIALTADFLSFKLDNFAAQLYRPAEKRRHDQPQHLPTEIQ